MAVQELQIGPDGMRCYGPATFRDAVTVPSGTWVNADVSTTAAIAATKLQHQHKIAVELYGPTTTVAALTKLLGIVYGAAAEVVAASAFVVTDATGADRTVTVDIQKSTGGAAFATILTTTIGFTNTTGDRTVIDAVVAANSLVTDDLLQAVVTVAGAAGNQALGLCLTVTLRESASP